jgi:hypothetical protein
MDVINEEFYKTYGCLSKWNKFSTDTIIIGGGESNYDASNYDEDMKKIFDELDEYELTITGGDEINNVDEISIDELITNDTVNDEVRHDEVVHDDTVNDEVRHDEVRHDEVVHDDTVNDEVRHDEVRHDEFIHDEVVHDEVITNDEYVITGSFENKFKLRHPSSVKNVDDINDFIELDSDCRSATSTLSLDDLDQGIVDSLIEMGYVDIDTDPEKFET